MSSSSHPWCPSSSVAASTVRQGPVHRLVLHELEQHVPRSSLRHHDIRWLHVALSSSSPSPGSKTASESGEQDNQGPTSSSQATAILPSLVVLCRLGARDLGLDGRERVSPTLSRVSPRLVCPTSRRAKPTRHGVHPPPSSHATSSTPSTSFCDSSPLSWSCATSPGFALLRRRDAMLHEPDRDGISLIVDTGA